MSDWKKILKGLETCSRLDQDAFCNECPYYEKRIWCMQYLAKDVLELMKEAEPEARCDTWPYHDSGWFIVCGCCHKEIDSGDEFCRHCGKKIKWPTGAR